MSRRQIANRLERVRKEINNIRPQAHRQFVSETPIDTGNARSRTDLRGTEIQANYPYAVRLEKESWSRQAPRGMSAPTIDFIRQIVRRML